jgi:hypothetical protein
MEMHVAQGYAGCSSLYKIDIYLIYIAWKPINVPVCMTFNNLNLCMSNSLKHLPTGP